MIIQGTNDNDAMIGTADADTIFGAYGSDTINGQPGNDLIYGEDGNDNLDGNHWEWIQSTRPVVWRPLRTYPLKYRLFGYSTSN